MAATTIVDFDPGDTLGKTLALVNQIRMSSYGVREYLAHACAMCEVKAIELLLWVRSRWGSLSHCLESTLKIQKVCFCMYLLFRIDTINRQLTISVLWRMIMRTSPL